MVAYNVNGQPQGQPIMPQSQGQPMVPQQMMQQQVQEEPMKSQLAKGCIGFLQNAGADLDKVTVQEENETTSIIFVEADNLDNRYLAIVTISNNDKSYSILVKKPVNISAMSRPKVLEFVNGLNENSFMITTFLIGGDEPGIVARIDRETSDISYLIGDIKEALNYAETQFNVRF